MKLIRLIVLALPLFAQTTRYPGAIDSDGSLFVVSDNVQTSLNVAMQTTDTTAVVASSTGFVPNMIATICDTSTSTGKCTAWEHMLVTAVAGNVLTLTRGFAGTSPRAHAAGLNVNILIDSVHQGVLKSSVIAIENALGPNLINIGLSPVVNSASYNFGAYSCNSSSACSPGGPSGMSLIAGNNTLTMNPVPNGVNGSDANHRLNVSAGTGGSEGCLITGGSGQSGQPSGQIIINCANTHSGSWTIQSAAGGIPEAIAAAAAAGGTVVIPSGTIPVTAAIQVPANITLAGNGQSATVLRVANGALAASPSWQLSGGPGGTYCVVCLVSGGSFERVRDITIDANGQNQAWIYYGDIIGNNVSNAIIDRVTVKNHPIAGGTGVTIQLLGHAPLSSNANNLISNASTIGIAGCTVPNGGGAYYIEGEGNRVISSYAVNVCDSPFVMSACDHCMIADSVADVGSGQMGTPTYSIEGATNSTFRNDQCIATGTNPHRYCVGIASSSFMQSVGDMVIGVSGTHVSGVLEIGANNSAFGATTPIVDTQIVSLHADTSSATTDCINLSQYVNKVTITGGSLVGCGGSGINIDHLDRRAWIGNGRTECRDQRADRRSRCQLRNSRLKHHQRAAGQCHYDRQLVHRGYLCRPDSIARHLVSARSREQRLHRGKYSVWKYGRTRVIPEHVRRVLGGYEQSRRGHTGLYRFDSRLRVNSRRRRSAILRGLHARGRYLRNGRNRSYGSEQRHKLDVSVARKLARIAFVAAALAAVLFLEILLLAPRFGF